MFAVLKHVSFGTGMNAICAVEHTPCETLGRIADSLKQEELPVQRIRTFRGERIPRRIGKYAGLIVMGGRWACMKRIIIQFCGRKCGLWNRP